RLLMGRNSCLRFAPCQLLYFYLRHGCPVQAGLPYPSRSLKGGPNTPYARKVPRSHYHHRAPLFLAASRATKNLPANCVFEVAIKDQLMSLPGVTAAEADKVIAGRPYDDPGELVTRGALPKNKYDRIADRLTAKK